MPWHGRRYQRGRWKSADPVNRALSAANAALYGVCQAAILSAGYSTALGFIHTGHALAFVHDVADLYKTEISIPTAFQVARDGPADVESRTRRLCRDAFGSRRLLERIVPDIERVLRVPGDAPDVPAPDMPMLWEPDGDVDGGVSYATPEGAPGERTGDG